MRGILTYHSLDDSGSAISLSPDTFRAHCDWLADSGVAVLGLEELFAAPPQVNAVALTFDDAFENFIDIALPALREREWPATVFVVTGHVGTTNAWGGKGAPGIPTLPLMDWQALERLSAAGIEVAAHTVQHPHLTTIDDTRLGHELEESQGQLRQRLGVQSRTFAYPYGAVDSRVRDAAARHFSIGVTTQFDVLGESPDPLLLPRLDAFYFRDTKMLAAWGSPRFLRFVRWRKRLRALRQSLQRDK